MEKLLVGKSLEHQLDTVIKELAPKLNVNQDDARVILNSVLEVLANSLAELD